MPTPRSDSKEQRIFLSPPHLSGIELELVREAFESNYIAPLGPMVDAFEREFVEYTGIPYAVALSSGTAAMHLALRNLAVGPGDEVFASTLTFIGSVTPIIFQGATPVFIDSDRGSWNIDADILAEELTRCARRRRLPKAVVPTDLYGQCADIDHILEACRAYGVPVVFDAAESLGATYKGRSAGSGGRAAIFSFNGNKIVTTSGGGMLASDDRDFIEEARALSQQARDPAPHYEHSRIGYNYRMSNILAAIGRGQLKVLGERVRRKREIFDWYRERLGTLPGIEFTPEAPYGVSTRWLTTVLITPEEFGADREAVRLALEAETIESRPLWKPMHMQPVFQIVQSEKRTVKSEKCKVKSEETAKASYAVVMEGERGSNGQRATSEEIRNSKFEILNQESRIQNPSVGQMTGNGQRATSEEIRNPKFEIRNSESTIPNPKSPSPRYAARVVGGAVSEDLFRRGLCLPSGTQMTEADLERVAGIIERVRERAR